MDVLFISVISVCAHMCVLCTCMRVQKPEGNLGYYLSPAFIFYEKGSLASLELNNLARLAREAQGQVCLIFSMLVLHVSITLQGFFFMWILGVENRSLCLQGKYFID